MKIVRLGEPKVIMSNPDSKHDYFAWPTAIRLKNGKIAVVASGFRLRHVCPFGKTVISYSENEGETYTLPAPVIDTVLDDRDGGISTFGESGVIVTSFNNTVSLQMRYAEISKGGTASFCRQGNGFSAYDQAYLDAITPEEQSAALGSTFRMSFDHGISFGSIYKAPVTSPHGPTELLDGSLVWVGNPLVSSEEPDFDMHRIEAHAIRTDGSSELLGAIDLQQDLRETSECCEVHAVTLDDGSLLAHIRVERKGDHPLFTLFQSVSRDGGRSWSEPRQILSDLGGAPSHLLKTSSGMLICSYSYRCEPYSVRVMFSKDNGDTWEDGQDLYVNGVNKDLGYPSTVELSDGSFITVFYAHRAPGESAVILQQKWKTEE